MAGVLAAWLTISAHAVAGSGNLRSLLQASPERHSHSHINAALTSDEVHAAAWRMADEVRHGRHIVDSELRTVVDTFARSVSKHALAVWSCGREVAQAVAVT